jgi:hypothetical protein
MRSKTIFFTILFLVSFGLLFYACTPSEQIISPTQFHTGSPLPPPTSTKTKTPFPTRTVTFTATPAPYATGTPFSRTPEPLISPPALEKTYQLTNWTPEKASQLIEYLKKYPDTLPDWRRGYIDSFYYHAYEYAGLIELESAFRFSESQQARTWRYDGAYNQLQSFNKNSSALYTKLLVESLNQQETNMDNIQTWFQQIEPRLNLKIIDTTPPATYQRSSVLHITAVDGDVKPGIAIWILQNNGEHFGYPLKNQFEINLVDSENEIEVVELTGDNIPEVILKNVEWQTGSMYDGSLVIYRLDQVPPRMIEFSPEPLNLEIADWLIGEPDEVSIITFTTPLELFFIYGCYDFSVEWQYQWNGENLQLLNILLPTIEEMEKTPVCSRVLLQGIWKNELLEISSGMNIYKTLLELPFIGEDLEPNEEPGFQQKARLELAKFLLGKGDVIGANEQIQLLVTTTDAINPTWGESAKEYLQIYRNQNALFQFCLTTNWCPTYLSTSELISLIPPGRISEADALLKQMGVEIPVSGNFDFDTDGMQEKWLMVKPTTGTCVIPFWILSSNVNGIISRNVSSTCNEEIKQVKINFLSQIQGYPVYALDFGDDYLDPHRFVYWQMDQKDPTFTYWQARERLNDLQTKLLFGDLSHQTVDEVLNQLQNMPIMVPGSPADSQAYQLYLTGLALELKGDVAQAALVYLELWQSYPEEPYGYIAYSKLEMAN